MKHDQRTFLLRYNVLSLYALDMSRRLFNHRLLGDKRIRDSSLFQFLDAYSMSIDVDPICAPPKMRQGADALWNDFVTIANDANHSINKHVGQSSKGRLRESK